MQACKLSIGEAHPSQVVKAEFDVPSQRAALLLQDSSCLLFLSLSGNSPPSLILPSCTDICFLRLRERSSHISSSSSDKSAETASRSDLKKLANVKGKSAMVGEERFGDAMARGGSVCDPVARVGSVGDAVAGSGDETLLFLTLKPAKGGVCTDLMAWRCSQLGFRQTPIFLEGCLEGCRSFSPQFSHLPSAMARLDDIPHGISVGIAASVNIVVVHSPAVGKVWILSAKISGAEQDNAIKPRSELAEEHSKDPMHKDTFNSALKADRKQHGKDRHGYLHLIKCAVVDCNGPVYALHLSLQHLLVGQLGGVRVWPLRRLIKGSMVKRKEFKVDAHCCGRGHCISKCGTRHDRTKILEGRECGKKILDTHRGLNDQDLIAFEGIGSGRTLKGPSIPLAGLKNGFYEVGVVGNGIINVKLATKTGYCDGSNNGEGNIDIEHQGFDWSGKPLEQVDSNGRWTCGQHVGATRKQSGSSDVQQVVSNASKVVQLEQVTMPMYRNGLLPFEFDLEELHSQHKLSQSSMLSSSSSSSLSLPASRGACAALCSSCHNLTSSLSSIAGETSSALHKAEFVKGAQDGVFVPFQNQMFPLLFTDFAKVEQVTSIHGLSEREFVILDSCGKLHLLDLQYSVRGDEARLERASRVSVNASLQPVICGIKVKMLTVLPVLHSDKRNSCSESRILWISDGCHTIYIVMLPARRGNSIEGPGKSLLGPISNPTVIQTVFTTDHICSLYALSLNAVMVLTEGSMLAYSSIGT